MRTMSIALVSIATASLRIAQQSSAPIHAGTGATSLSEISNLPVEKIGNSDLVGITVYDSPELTRTVRVGSEGEIRLPMLKQPIQAAGLFPAELEKTINDSPDR